MIPYGWKTCPASSHLDEQRKCEHIYTPTHKDNYILRSIAWPRFACNHALLSPPSLLLIVAFSLIFLRFTFHFPFWGNRNQGPQWLDMFVWDEYIDMSNHAHMQVKKKKFNVTRQSIWSLHLWSTLILNNPLIKRVIMVKLKKKTSQLWFCSFKKQNP